jgi:hypothetical protein
MTAVVSTAFSAWARAFGTGPRADFGSFVRLPIRESVGRMPRCRVHDPDGDVLAFACFADEIDLLIGATGLLADHASADPE